MSTPKESVLFSVMLLSLPSRLKSCLIQSYDRLMHQVGDRKDVEIICLIDNKMMTIGEKRQAILNIARGKWVGFLDDDDAISDDYISSLTDAMLKNPADVITFDQHCTVNGEEFKVNFRVNNPIEGLNRDSQGKLCDIKRPPYHMCMWVAHLAKKANFQSISYGEDLNWCMQMYPHITSETHIDKILHYYKFSDSTSESLKA